MKVLIHKFKYAKLKFLCRTLNDMVTTRTSLKELVQDVDMIVPVPLHWYKNFIGALTSQNFYPAAFKDIS